MAELLRELLKTADSAKAIYEDNLFVLVHCLSKGYIKTAVFLLEKVKSKKGFRDRIFLIGGQEFEVFNVKVIMKCLKTQKINNQNSGNHLESNKTAPISVWKMQKPYGKFFYLGFCSEVQAWVMCFGKKVCVYLENSWTIKCEEKAVFSYAKNQLEKIFSSQEAQIEALGHTLKGFISYDSRNSVKFCGVIFNELGYLNPEACKVYLDKLALESIEFCLYGRFDSIKDVMINIFSQNSETQSLALSDIYFISKQECLTYGEDILHTFRVPNSLSQAKGFLVSKLRYLKVNFKGFDISFLSKIEKNFNLGPGQINSIFELYKVNHPDLIINSQNVVEPVLEKIENGIPIVLVSSFSFKESHQLSIFLNYKLQKAKRGVSFEAGTIYESDDASESLFLSKKALFVFIQWDSLSKEKFLANVREMKKSDLPQRLMKYSKKKGEEAIPEINRIYEEINSKIESFQNSCPEYILNITCQYPEDEFIEIQKRIAGLPRFSTQIEEEKKEPDIKKIDENLPVCFILIPMGIPGMGKTHIRPAVQQIVVESGIEFFTLSSDEERNQAMVKYKQKNLGADHEKAFIKSSKSSNKEYYNKLISKLKSNTRPLFVFLDKNHPPSAFEALYKQLASENIKNTLIRLISLVPKCESRISVSNKFYEFSLEFIVACISRAVKRDNHLTLTGSPDKIGSVVLSMLSLYKNHELSRDFNSGKVQYFVQVPFANESEIKVPEGLKEKLLSQIKKISPKLESNSEIAEIVNEIMTVDIPPFDNFLHIKNAILDILKFFKLDERVEKKTSEKSLAKGPKEKPIKPPIYIGVCVEAVVRHAAVDILIDVLSKLQDFYKENIIKRDLEQIELFKIKQPSKWKHPHSYHITSLFIGGNQEKLNSKEYLSFIPGVEVQIKITHIVYCPTSIACAKAEVVHPKIEIENKFPHITLLLGNQPAKYSNTILQHAGFDEEFNRRNFKEGKYNQTVFSYTFAEPLEIIGTTKYFN